MKVQRDLDFGNGFYTASDFEQAKSWAKRKTKIRGTGTPVVSCYDADERAFDNLRILRFEQADRDWLAFVANNRRGIFVEETWDLVTGPVANDQTFPTLLLYLDGFLDAESTIRQLLPQKLKDQYAFKTEQSIRHLRFQEAISV